MSINLRGVVTVLLPGTGSDDDYLRRVFAGPLQDAGAVVFEPRAIGDVQEKIAEAAQGRGVGHQVFVGGVVPRQDYDMLYAAGVKGIYGPGTPIPVSASDVLEQIGKALADASSSGAG